MDKLTIEVPEGEYCGNKEGENRYCPIMEYDVDRGKGYWYCSKWGDLKFTQDNKTVYKHPACISACQQYRDEHSWEKARAKIISALHDGIELACNAYKADAILKALHYKKGVK